MNNLVSVCIPVYNSERTIKTTIESILNQTYKELEIIIVDNCSSDNTWQIINSFFDTRIKKYRNETNIGMVRNWNKCLEYTTGKYIHFLCGDDILTPNCIERKVCLADTDESITLVFSASQVINESDEIVLERRQFKESCVVDGRKLASKSFRTKNLYGEPSNVLFRKCILDKNFSFSINMLYAIDWEMWLRLSVIGSVGYINEPLMKYRISKSNATSNFSVKKIIADDRIFTKNLLKFNVLELNFIEIIYHRLVIIFRLYARKIFMKVRG